MNTQTGTEVTRTTIKFVGTDINDDIKTDSNFGKIGERFTYEYGNNNELSKRFEIRSIVNAPKSFRKYNRRIILAYPI